MNTPAPPAPGYVVPPRLWSWLGSQWTLAVLLWTLALGTAANQTRRAYHYFDNPSDGRPDRARADGNSGHVQIDFGGQWLMGRMVVTGNGRELYHRHRQREVLRAGYRVEAESPRQREGPPERFLGNPEWTHRERHDADNLMGWFMGTDPADALKATGGAAAALLGHPGGHPLAQAALHEQARAAVTTDTVAALEKPAIGGPLYPPVHALFYAPLSLIDDPQRAYRVFQGFAIAITFACALGVKLLTGGRVWWSVATFVLFIYPGTRGGLDLAQNPAVSLCILVWGWVLLTRNRPVAGGIVWGLFAFKPVWAAAFLVVPLLMGRWRFALAMSLTGLGFVLATLPVVGIDSWFHWLQIGREAADLYKVNTNWIHLSRDLHGIPRRILYDFDLPESKRETRLGNALGWALWGAVFVGTAAVYRLRGDRTRATGLSAALVFLGAYLTCYRFMYYDVLLSAAAVALLVADPQLWRGRAFAFAPGAVGPHPDPRALAPPASSGGPFGSRMVGYLNSFPLTVVLALLLAENVVAGMEMGATVTVGYITPPGSENPLKVQADTGLRYPTDTFLLLALWAWCAWRVAAGDDRPAAV